jgi:hypothetical protein
MVRECNVDGYASPNPILKVFEGLRRSPRSRWFALIRAIDTDRYTQFEISTERTSVMPAGGILTCFANDVAWT